MLEDQVADVKIELKLIAKQLNTQLRFKTFRDKHSTTLGVTLINPTAQALKRFVALSNKFQKQQLNPHTQQYAARKNKNFPLVDFIMIEFEFTAGLYQLVYAVYRDHHSSQTLPKLYSDIEYDDAYQEVRSIIYDILREKHPLSVLLFKVDEAQY